VHQLHSVKQSWHEIHLGIRARDEVIFLAKMDKINAVPQHCSFFRDVTLNQQFEPRQNLELISTDTVYDFYGRHAHCTDKPLPCNLMGSLFIAGLNC
jgi:hypothetical protein